MKQSKETFHFQTEVKQLLHLVIHSLYSNKEIFLRELVSNASDAADKLRFEALQNKNLLENDPELKIWVDFDEKEKTITIRDNGIGMTHDEVVSNIGTIAKSGTKEYLSQLTQDQAKNTNLIGQFGVGFYSAFIVAHKVTLRTRKAGAKPEEAVQWESTGEGDYTLENIKKDGRGTEVVLHIKDEEKDFLNYWRLRNIIVKYSDHISWPIYMINRTEDEKQKGKEEIINKATALWALPKSSIKEDEYKELYKHLSHDFDDPLIWSHNHVEGKQHYITLLYIPKHAPFDLAHREVKRGLKLYVQRVFILDDAEQFLPQYLRFVKGIIDSSDLPLNISRELLQQNELVDSIKAAIIKRTLGTLEKLKEDKEKYQIFWREFGKVIKEGIIEDYANREDIAKLLKFASTHDESPEQNVTLDDYINRMKPSQDKIYYLTAETLNAAKHSPHLEFFRKQGIEVILFFDRIDEWVVSHLSEYKGKLLQSVAKGKLDILDTESEKVIEKAKDQLAGLTKRIQEVLKEQVKEVRLSSRLTESPSCLVVDEHDMGREMQRLLKISGQTIPSSKPILEINPNHPIIKKLDSIHETKKFGDWAWIVYDQAILAEGGNLEDPGSFVKRLNDMLLSLSLID